MSGLTDLQAALATEDTDLAELATAVTTALADIATEVATLQAAAGGDDDAAVETAAQNVNALITQTQSVLSQVTAADPGAPAPPA
jgi:hypothetical protein